MAAATSSTLTCSRSQTHRRTTGVLDIDIMISVADQTDNLVASGRQHRREPEGDLAVSASDCDLQTGVLLRVRPRWS